MADLSDYPDLPQDESDEAIAEAMARLRPAFFRIDEIHRGFSQFEVLDGSSLSFDDGATRYEPLSYQVRTGLSVALDNLRTVRLIAESGTWPAFSHLALIRNAIEAIGVATWALAPESTDTRVLRSLQLAYEDRSDMESLHAAARGEQFRDLPNDDSVRVLLEGMRDERRANVGLSLKPPAITRRLAEAQVLVESAPNHKPTQNYRSMLVSWKWTSGISHGRRQAIYASLDRQVLDSDHLGAEIKMTTNVGIMAGLFLHTEFYLLRLAQLVLQRNAPSPSYG